MQLDPQKASERLNSPNNLANRIKEFRSGRKLSLDVDEEGRGVLTVHSVKSLPRLPGAAVNEIRERISSGTERQQDIAESFGVSQAAISYQKRVSDKEIENKEKAAEIDERAKVARSIAIDKMLLTMGLITEEKLEKLRAKDLATTARELSIVQHTLNPKDKAPAAQVNLVVYAPEVRSEESYKILEISSSNG